MSQNSKTAKMVLTHMDRTQLCKLLKFFALIFAVFSRLLSKFLVLDFMTQTTRGVGKGKIQMTPSNNPGPKIGRQVQTARNYRLLGPSYSQLCFKIRCHGNRRGKGKILMTLSDSPGPKIGGQVQTARNYFSRRPNYSQFCSKIRCHGNRGRKRKNLNDTVGQREPENRGQVKTARNLLSFTRTQLYRFEQAIMHNF